MPTDTKIEIVIVLFDGTKITRIENLEDVTSFIEQYDGAKMDGGEEKA